MSRSRRLCLTTVSTKTLKVMRGFAYLQAIAVHEMTLFPNARCLDEKEKAKYTKPRLYERRTPADVLLVQRNTLSSRRQSFRARRKRN